MADYGAYSKPLKMQGIEIEHAPRHFELAFGPPTLK